MDRASQTNASQTVSLEAQRSCVEDVDFAKTILDLQTQQTTYQTSLGVTAKVLQPLADGLPPMSAALTFIAPPPGFAPLVDFTLDEIEGAQGLYALRCGRRRGSGCSCSMPESTCRSTPRRSRMSRPHRSNSSTGEDALVLVVANPGESGTTMNLMAPIVVNSVNGRCAQFILDGRRVAVARAAHGPFRVSFEPDPELVVEYRATAAPC